MVLSEEITSCELRLADEEEEKRKKESKQPLCLKRLKVQYTVGLFNSLSSEC